MPALHTPHIVGGTGGRSHRQTLWSSVPALQGQAQRQVRADLDKIYNTLILDQQNSESLDCKHQKIVRKM